MWTLKWFLFLPVCLSCSYAFVFSSLREPPGKVPCEGHFRIRQNLAEHTQGWLGSKWLWLFFVVMLYVGLKFRGGREKTKEKNPSLRGCSFRTSPKKSQNVPPSKDYALTTLTQLEMDLVKFVSRVRDLKTAVAAGRNLKVPGLEMPTDPNDNVTIYEIWGERDSE